MRPRWILFFVLLGVSVLLSVLGSLYFRSPFLALFLFFPFIPFVFGRRQEASAAGAKACPTCGYATEDPLASYCPRDASRLRASQ